MDQQERSRWRPTRRQLLWAGGIAALAFLIIVICGYLFGWKWTGLPKRTLWDWLDLLIIPAVLAIGGYLFTRSENRATHAAAERRTQDEALQAYLDQMSAMLIPNKDQPTLYDERPPDSLKTVARARTLTVLPRLDVDRKAPVVQVLYEAGLITEDRVIVDLRGADLRGANLRKADLRGVSLMGADLMEANLSRANLSGANLSEAELSFANLMIAKLMGANLMGAKLMVAKLVGANLSGAYLSGAYLSGAYLSRAYLSRANLSEADLRGAKEWTEGQLAAAESLTDATMPDGQHYEVWLKSKGRREDGENRSSS